LVPGLKSSWATRVKKIPADLNRRFSQKKFKYQSAKICGKILKENRNYRTKHLTKTNQRSAKICGKKICEIISKVDDSENTLITSVSGLQSSTLHSSSFILHPCHVPILIGSDLFKAFELAVEITGIIKTGLNCDIRKSAGSVLNEIFRKFNAFSI